MKVQLKSLFILLLGFLYLFNSQKSLAIVNPLEFPNNRFGIHIIDENDIQDATVLVNSSGGDWGYVQIVIREDDRNIDKWQAVFNRLRRNHLIPIIRLATKVERGMWIKPRKSDINSWADFLANLNWVIKNRYIIVFNEPNHAKEWGGEINPEEYGWYLKEFSRKLKEKSADFFILPAGLDASAPDSMETLTETAFIKRMLVKEPDVYNYIDGWTSHSYPNPGFAGSPIATGQGTVNTYLWELNYLKNLNINKDLPVFITETGWRHNSGKNMEYEYPTPELVAQNYSIAFNNAWNNYKIAAVIPFLLNYQDKPFDHFSFKKINSGEFYPIYDIIRQIPKIQGQPAQINSVRIINNLLPAKLVKNSVNTFEIIIENTGQSMLGKAEGWQLSVRGLPEPFKTDIEDIALTDPFGQTRIKITTATPDNTGIYPYSLIIKKGEEVIIELPAQFNVIPPPDLAVSARLWFNKKAQGSDYKLLIYDDKDKLLKVINNIFFDKGYAYISNLYNILPNQKYRLVLVKPYYLPRQIHVFIKEKATYVRFSRLIPGDFSNDGRLNPADIKAFFQKPLQFSRLLLPL